MEVEFGSVRGKKRAEPRGEEEEGKRTEWGKAVKFSGKRKKINEHERIKEGKEILDDNTDVVEGVVLGVRATLPQPLHHVQ